MGDGLRSRTTSSVHSLAVGFCATLVLALVAGSCAADDRGGVAVSGIAVDGLSGDSETIEVDVFEEARAHNGGAVFEFVVDESGYVSAPEALPGGTVTVTLTYVGESPAPHSLVFDGMNGNQPVVAVDLPGSNNGSVVLPPGPIGFFDGAPGNRQRGYRGTVDVIGAGKPRTTVEPVAVVEWRSEGLEFVSAPIGVAPADAPIALGLTVGDHLPHSVALERVRDEQPLVAVDGPGSNRRTITLRAGTYVYFCAVPGHRDAGMEGLFEVG